MFEDRQYQIDAVNYAMADQGRPILCSPTGSGKSYILARVAQETIAQGKTFTVLTPREEILKQMADTMGEVCGFQNVGILKSGQHWNRMRPVQVVSWPTLLARTARSDVWFPDSDTLAIDECHLALSPKMAERVLPYYEDRSKIIGVTATPARKSGRGLGSFFTHIKHVTTVRQLIKEGKLCPLEYWGGRLVDVSGVRTTAGDFNSKQLSLAAQPLIGDVLDNWGRLASDRHTLVFAVDVPHCEALTERFQQAGVKAASLHIHKTPERRRQIVEAFKAGRIQVLVNVSIASYGFDAPSVDCIVMARPTKSIVLHLQMLGRGMRIHPDKSECMVLDHADNVRRLGQADDLFRWRLDGRKKAAGNWTRNPKSADHKKGEDKMHECAECHYIFSRSLTCPKCGQEIPLPKRDRDAVDADLVRISAQKYGGMPKGWPEPRRFYLMLLCHARRCGMNDGWAYYSYLDFAKENPELRPQKPPFDWKNEEPIRPTVRVKNWIDQGRKAYVRAKQTNAA